MPLGGTRDDENGFGLVSFGRERVSWRIRPPSGRRPCLTGACKPVSESGPDVDTYPGLSPPAVGEHVEQTVTLLDVSRRQAFFGGAPWTRCFPR